MRVTLKLTDRATGVEVRRGTYDVVLAGERVGSLGTNDTFETPVEPGHHTLQVRDGRHFSRTHTLNAADGETVACHCTGKGILAIFPLSFAVPSLALSLHREWSRRAAGPMQPRAVCHPGTGGRAWPVPGAAPRSKIIRRTSPQQWAKRAVANATRRVFQTRALPTEPPRRDEGVWQEAWRPSIGGGLRRAPRWRWRPGGR